MPKDASETGAIHASRAASDRLVGPRIVLVGATLTGNRGAEAMLRAAVQRIPEQVPGARFTLLSLYANDDREEDRDALLEIVPFSPMHMVFVAFPLAVLAGVSSRLGLSTNLLLRTKSLRAIARADLVIDLSGISFVDGRGVILVYNVLLVLLPVLLRTPLVKYAQAMGPFRGWLNRTCAKWLLPKVACIAARGRQTRAHLDALGILAERIMDCADAAFAMQAGTAACERVRPLVEGALFEKPVVAVSASSVVERLCAARALPYAERMVAFIRYLIDDKGYAVCLIAHSARPGRVSRKNNDLPICREIVRCVERAACVFPEEVLNAEALRVLIRRCRLLVASRFHAMIAGLAEGVPTMLVGWSHKYAEVLEMFELDEYALDYGDLTDEKMQALFAQLEAEQETVRAKIAAHLPAVVASSMKNARMAADVLAGVRR